MVDLSSEAMANPQSDHLADHAATAALYVTNPDRGRPNSDAVDTHKNPPAADGSGPALSFAPSEPSQLTPGGLNLASAGAAASLAHGKFKPVQPWTPGEQPGAEKAALLAHRHRHLRGSAEQPESTSSDPRANPITFPKIARPEPSYSAAGRVMTGTRQVPNEGMPTRSEGARLAAAGAMSGSMRRSSYFVPDGPDMVQRNHSHAMSAAVTSHRISRASGATSEGQDTAIDGSHAQRDPNTTATEARDKLKQDTTHAAALSMARQMYTVATELDEDQGPAVGLASHHASSTGHPRKSSRPGLSTTSEPMPYRRSSHTQDHAGRLVAQRMSSLYDENMAYRDYYGVNSRRHSGSQIADRFRRRSSSDSDGSKFDRERSRRIRSEMHTFTNRLDEVDSKRNRDRASLLAAAERNVKLEMQHMDERICADTGRPSPAMVQACENKLRQRRESADSGQIETFGKSTVVGGGYADREEFHILAKKRLQPTFDDIEERAEQERERVEQERAREVEERLDEEQRQRLAAIEREREAEKQEAQKRMKELQKEQEKAEKAKRADRRRQEKEDNRLWKRRSKESKGKQRATDESPSPDVSATASPLTETYPQEEERKQGATFAGYHRYGNDPTRVKNGESSGSQASPIREQENHAPVQGEREPSLTPSTAKSDAERIKDWIRAKRYRTSADKTSSVEDSRIQQGKEELGKGQRDHPASQKPLMSAAGVRTEQEPEAINQGNGEGPSHATALRSHPVTNGDIPEGEAPGQQPGSEAVRDEANHVRKAKSADESGIKSQNRRSKRWSLKGLLGRDGQENVVDETQAPAEITTDRVGDTIPQESSQPAETRVGESNVRDSRFVENL